jgi:hypothetical protein
MDFVLNDSSFDIINTHWIVTAIRRGFTFEGCLTGNSIGVDSFWPLDTMWRKIAVVGFTKMKVFRYFVAIFWSRGRSDFTDICFTL